MKYHNLGETKISAAPQKLFWVSLGEGEIDIHQSDHLTCNVSFAAGGLPRFVKQKLYRPDASPRGEKNIILCCTRHHLFFRLVSIYLHARKKKGLWHFVFLSLVNLLRVEMNRRSVGMCAWTHRAVFMHLPQFWVGAAGTGSRSSRLIYPPLYLCLARRCGLDHVSQVTPAGILIIFISSLHCPHAPGRDLHRRVGHAVGDRELGHNSLLCSRRRRCKPSPDFQTDFKTGSTTTINYSDLLPAWLGVTHSN